MSATGEHVKPSIGRIVIYRNRNGVDVASIVTALAGDSETAVHLRQFPPPGEGEDIVSHEWGVDLAKDPANPLAGTWRWPERVT